MEKCAIWKDHKVVGYIDLTEEQKRILNKVPGIGVYFGFDRTTRSEKYAESYKQTLIKIDITQLIMYNRIIS